MFFYKGYGLNINSKIALPELNISDVGSDVTITFGNIKIPDENFEEYDYGGNFKVKTTCKDIFLLLDNITICKINLGKEIIVNPHTGLDESFLRIVILESALPLLLHQKGKLILHASAIDMGGAVAFLGTNGSGKSTTLFALHKKNYPIITDDVLSVTVNNNDLPIVTPSYSRLKLLPDVMNYMQEDLNSALKIQKYSEKFSYFANNFSYNQIPLKKIYIVEKGKKCGLNSLNSVESLMRLIESSYCYRIFSKTEIAENLIKCSKIIENVPVKVLNIQHSLEQLPEVIKVIEHDNK